MFIVLTVLVHAGLDTLGESASATLVPVGLVHQTPALRLALAHVLPRSPDGPLLATRGTNGDSVSQAATHLGTLVQKERGVAKSF